VELVEEHGGRLRASEAAAFLFALRRPPALKAIFTMVVTAIRLLPARCHNHRAPRPLPSRGMASFTAGPKAGP